MGANVCTCLCRDLVGHVEMARDKHQLPSPALCEPGNFKHSGGHQETGKGEDAGQRRRGKSHQVRQLSTPNSVLYPLSPQALLLLGLNPVSTSLQDQQCESLSLASNVSGELPLPLTSQDARFSQGLLPWRGLY